MPLCGPKSPLKPLCQFDGDIYTQRTQMESQITPMVCISFLVEALGKESLTALYSDISSVSSCKTDFGKVTNLFTINITLAAN